MDRPFKHGLQNFPCDVDIFDDKKLQNLNYQAGPLAEFVYIRILTLIYANGYYIKHDRITLARVLHKKIGPEWKKLEKISELIDACLEVGLFDKTLAAQGVMTSVSIQKQFILSTIRRMNAGINEYGLLDEATLLKLQGFLSVSEGIVSANKKIVNADNYQINANIKQQKRKETKSDKKINKDKRESDVPYLHYITHALIKSKYIDEFSLEVSKYNKLFEDTCRAYGFDHVSIVANYIDGHVKRTSNTVHNRFAFMKESLINNLETYHHGGGNQYESIEDWLKKLQPMDK